MALLEASPMSSTLTITADAAYTGPDTPAGKYMRLFWQPIYVARRLPIKRAMPIRVMSETFTLYRDENGVPHVVGFRCAHRGTQLSTGKVQGETIRCLYHGWAYNGSGACVEQPPEKAEFASKVRIPGYPTREYLGLIWTYFGPDEPPEFRRFPQLENPGDDGIQLTLGGNPRPFNYVNDLENDPAHVPFVHGGTDFFSDVPQVRSEETDYGSCETVSTEERGDIGWVHRIFPNSRCFTIALPHGVWVEFMLWLVPIDDANHAAFAAVMAHREGGRTEEFLHFMHEWEEQAIAPDEIPEIAARILRGEITLDDVSNVASIRERRILVGVQDAVAQWGQGIIRNRDDERLGRSDIGVILLRKIWDRELRALAEGGQLKIWKMPERFKIDPHYHG
jgi:5,5'-dehydrodivanillate O-demethylase oxygenase subunit